MDWGVSGHHHFCVVGIRELVEEHEVMSYVPFDEQGGSRLNSLEGYSRALRYSSMVPG
jgi:hypothetical protein